MNLKSYKVNKFGMIGNGYYDIAITVSVYGSWMLTHYIRKYLKKRPKFIFKNWNDRDSRGHSNAFQLSNNTVQLSVFGGAFVVFSKTRIMRKTQKLLTPYLEVFYK